MATDATREKPTNWTEPALMEAILTQVLASGKQAFMTHKANVKANPNMGIEGVQYNQKEVWTNERDGIIPMLKKHPQKLFANVNWPREHVSLVQAVERFLNAHDYLYTPGKEQGLPLQ